ncbi:uncharacterized [Tachysurus ichikawai]
MILILHLPPGAFTKSPLPSCHPEEARSRHHTERARSAQISPADNMTFMAFGKRLAMYQRSIFHLITYPDSEDSKV